MFYCLVTNLNVSVGNIVTPILADKDLSQMLKNSDFKKDFVIDLIRVLQSELSLLERKMEEFLDKMIGEI